MLYRGIICSWGFHEFRKIKKSSDTDAVSVTDGPVNDLNNPGQIWKTVALLFEFFLYCPITERIKDSKICVTSLLVDASIVPSDSGRLETWALG